MLKNSTFIYLFWRVHMHAIVHMWRSEKNLWKLVLSFYHVGPGDLIQAGWLASTFTHLSISPAHTWHFNQNMFNMLWWLLQLYNQMLVKDSTLTNNCLWVKHSHSLYSFLFRTKLCYAPFGNESHSTNKSCSCKLANGITSLWFSQP